MAKVLKIMVNPRFFFKKKFRISWYPAVFEIFSRGLHLPANIYLIALSFYMDRGAETFCLNSGVHGHHIYKDIWSSVQCTW